MKVLLTGSRTWPNKQRGPIEALIRGLPAECLFIVGDCPTGVDAIVRAVCDDIQKNDCVPVDIHVEPAEWTKYGDAAGPRRNGIMVAMNPNVCFAFRDEGYSPGTEDCIRQAVQAGIPTYIMRKVPTDIDQEYTIQGPGKRGKK